MTMHLLLLGFIGALSGSLAIVASLRIDPYYSWLIRAVPSVRVNYVPEIKRLYSARRAIEESKGLQIRDGHREHLQTVHDLLIDEGLFSGTYYPIRLVFYPSALKFEYSDGRKEQRGMTQDELISLLDSKISKAIGKVAASLGVIAVLAFAGLIILAVA